jgi:Tol biopolymer transport system component
VTSLPGSEEDPALSPDGQSVAFSWSNSDDVNHDIWIKSVTGDAKRNLTHTPGTSEDWPRWSPNGQWITFSRQLKTGSEVIKVSPLGGAEDRIGSDAYDASWTPDSLALIMVSITPERHDALVYQELKTGARHNLTDAPAGFEDRHPRVSPDGKTVAFVRIGQGQSAIFRVPLAGGAAVRVGEWANGLPIGGLEWMPDGRELLAAKWTVGIRRLMRIPVSGRGPEVTVPGLPYEVAGLSLSRLGPRNRLALSVGHPDIGLRLVDLATPRSAGAIAADSPFCDATRIDIPGRFSRDGKQVAFTSNRDGSFQVWVADRDGSALRPVTHLEDAMVSLGSWSPEGGRLAFDVTVRNHTDIYTVAVGGGAVTKLNEGAGNASDPEWSRDGRWIYFSSDRSGSPAIWKMPANRGIPEQLTFEAGFDPRESPDERTVYFMDRPKGFGVGPRVTLKQVSVDGGRVEDVPLHVPHGAWDVTDSGIAFVADQSDGIQNSRGGRDVLQQYDFADHHIRTIARLGFLIGPYGVPRFLAVSRDGQWALASHTDHWERDIVAIDGFR